MRLPRTANEILGAEVLLQREVAELEPSWGLDDDSSVLLDLANDPSALLRGEIEHRRDVREDLQQVIVVEACEPLCRQLEGDLLQDFLLRR